MKAETDHRSSFLRTFPVTEFLDHVAAGYRMKCQRIHVMVCRDVVAKPRIIGGEHVARRRRPDVFVVVMPGMKQPRGVPIDAPFLMPRNSVQADWQ
jgi:hypothetical protein